MGKILDDGVGVADAWDRIRLILIEFCRHPLHLLMIHGVMCVLYASSLDSSSLFSLLYVYICSQADHLHNRKRNELLIQNRLVHFFRVIKFIVFLCQLSTMS